MLRSTEAKASSPAVGRVACPALAATLGTGGGGDCGRPEDGGVWTSKTVKQPPQQPAHPQYANYLAPLTSKRHTNAPFSTAPAHQNWAPRTQKRHQREHRPQRPTERSDPTQHAKGRTGDCPGPRKRNCNPTECHTGRGQQRHYDGEAASNPHNECRPLLRAARVPASPGPAALGARGGGGGSGGDYGKKSFFPKVVPRPLGMLKQVFLANFEPVGTRIGPWKIPKCLEKEPFWDQKWVKNGSKTRFSISDPAPFERRPDAHRHGTPGLRGGGMPDTPPHDTSVVVQGASGAGGCLARPLTPHLLWCRGPQGQGDARHAPSQHVCCGAGGLRGGGMPGTPPHATSVVVQGASGAWGCPARPLTTRLLWCRGPQGQGDARHAPSRHICCGAGGLRGGGMPGTPPHNTSVVVQGASGAGGCPARPLTARLLWCRGPQGQGDARHAPSRHICCGAGGLRGGGDARHAPSRHICCGAGGLRGRGMPGTPPHATSVVVQGARHAPSQHVCCGAGGLRGGGMPGTPPHDTSVVVQGASGAGGCPARPLTPHLLWCRGPQGQGDARHAPSCHICCGAAGLRGRGMPGTPPHNTSVVVQGASGAGGCPARPLTTHLLWCRGPQGRGDARHAPS